MRFDNCELIQKSIEKNEFENVHVYQNALAESRQVFDFSVDIMAVLLKMKKLDKKFMIAI